MKSIKNLKGLLIIASLLLSHPSFSQTKKETQILEGRITSKGQSLPFATIGIPEKNTGTISDENGRFNLQIPQSLLNDTLTVSFVGFRSQQFSIKKLLKTDSIELQLEEDVTLLNEIEVHARRPKTRSIDLGNKKMHDLFLWIKNGAKGAEIATLMDLKKEAFLNTVSLHIQNNRGLEFQLLLNIYEQNAETGLPGKQLLKRQKVIRSNQREGWLVVDISDQDVLVSRPFFVSFQWPDTQEPIPVIGAKIEKNNTSYVRHKAFGSWEQFANWDIKANCSVVK